MSHYNKERENDMCGIEKQINNHCNADNDAITCPCCREVLDEICNGKSIALYCSFCETEVEHDEE